MTNCVHRDHIEGQSKDGVFYGYCTLCGRSRTWPVSPWLRGRQPAHHLFGHTPVTEEAMIRGWERGLNTRRQEE